MNLSRCENGHFYDKEKYASCPHCSQGAGEDNSLTTIFTEDLNSGAMETQPLGEPTLPVGGVRADIPTMPSPEDNATMPLNQPPVGAPVTAPVPTPVAPGDWVAPDGGSMVTPSPGPFSAGDDDHTMAFYDDIFSDVTGGDRVSGATVPIGRPADRVTTPCVGWLVAIGGEHIGQDFRLKVGKNFIGRNPQMDIALTGDKSVSRNRHAIVVYEPKKHLYLIQPGESSELVYRNNEVVLNPVQLEAYDMITVGEVNLLFMPLCGAKFNWSDLLEEMEKEKKDK